MKALHSSILQLSLCGCFALTCAMLPAVGFAQDSSPAQTANPDNSVKNKAHHKTAEQQSSASSDRDLTAKIRRSIVADKALSTYAHNVKIITQDGQVTLKGPVHSDEEKTAIASKAAEVAGGQEKVTNQLTVKQ